MKKDEKDYPKNRIKNFHIKPGYQLKNRLKETFTDEDDMEQDYKDLFNLPEDDL